MRRTAYGSRVSAKRPVSLPRARRVVVRVARRDAGRPKRRPSCLLLFALLSAFPLSAFQPFPCRSQQLTVVCMRSLLESPAMNRAWIVLALALALSAHAGGPMMSEPSLSPDGKELVFVSGGDLWVAPARGGEAHLLVSHP